MENLIDYCNKKYFVKLGDKLFSPLLETTIGLSLDYCELVKKNGNKNPFLLCFPEKKSASLWLTVSLLTNYYLDDYISSENMANIDLKNGDLIDLYGSIVQYLGMDDKDRIIIGFNDESTYYLSSSVINSIKFASKKRVNTPDHFLKRRKMVLQDRTSISKILFPNETVIINEDVLDSKVLLVSGRGNTKSLRHLLANTFFYGEPLSKIFIENKNLIIKPDLDLYKDLFYANYENKYSKFFNLFNILTESVYI